MVIIFRALINKSSSSKGDRLHLLKRHAFNELTRKIDRKEDSVLVLRMFPIVVYFFCYPYLSI